MGNIEGGPEISNPLNSIVKKNRLKKEEIERENLRPKENSP